MRPFLVAIDGPAGSGKSSSAKMLAKLLGFRHIDSGSLYRAMTFKAIQANLDLKNGDELYDYIKTLKIDLQEDEQGSSVLVDGSNVDSFIRTPQVSNNVSTVAKHPKIREQILPLQRKLGNDPKVKGVVCEGRDIGTVVFPNADLKIFLIADPRVRAERRMKQNPELTDLEQVLQEILARDEADMNREHAPLKKASDAVEVDTTGMKISEQVQHMAELVSQRIKARA